MNYKDITVGIVTFEILRPLGLFHFSETILVGSLNFLIFLIELIISKIFFSFKISLSIKFFFRENIKVIFK